MMFRYVLYFLFTIQFLTLLLIYYSPDSWGISESLFTKLFFLKEISFNSDENISSTKTLLGSVSIIEDLEANGTEKPPPTVELILDIQRNISLKISSVNDGLQNTSVNGTFGAKFTPQFNKFIFTGPVRGGYGYQMFRFATHYAIGQMLGRSPVYTTDEMIWIENEHSFENEIATVFPIFYGMIYFIPRQDSLTRRFHLALSCCDYHDPQEMLSSPITEPLLELVGGTHFHNYNYFHKERDKTREIFNFSQEVRHRVQNVTSLLYRDKSHKLCIHVRIGDFKQYMWESNPEKTSVAIERITQNYMEKGTNYSLVFIGEEKEFFKQVALSEEQKRNVIVTPQLPRGDEMCFGATACDSLLITAHMSTFSFWIGYLMPENSPIYYIANFNKTMYPLGRFPPEWVHLEL